MAPALGGADPGAFTRQRRVAPARRMRTAWAGSDYRSRLDERIRAPRLAQCQTIAVVSPKGGPGKTTISALLGSLLAHLRRDRVIAVDANPDFGSLGRRLVPAHTVFIDDLLAGALAQEGASVTELDTHLGRGPDGLMVVPAPTDPARARALDEAAYRALFARLRELAGTLVLDCGTGLEAPPARAALAGADQLVLVTDAEPDTASLVWEAARWLEHDAPPLWLVVNKLQRRSPLDVAALERLIPFARGLATVPHNPPPPSSCKRAGSAGAGRPPTGRSPSANWPRCSSPTGPAPVPREPSLPATAAGALQHDRNNSAPASTNRPDRPRSGRAPRYGRARGTRPDRHPRPPVRRLRPWPATASDPVARAAEMAPR